MDCPTVFIVSRYSPPRGILGEQLCAMFVADQAVILWPFLPSDMHEEDQALPLSARWLELAEIAFRLDDARKKQEQIKEAIRPSIEKYQRIRNKSK